MTSGSYRRSLCHTDLPVRPSVIWTLQEVLMSYGPSWGDWCHLDLLEGLDDTRTSRLFIDREERRASIISPHL